MGLRLDVFPSFCTHNQLGGIVGCLGSWAMRELPLRMTARAPLGLVAPSQTLKSFTAIINFFIPYNSASKKPAPSDTSPDRGPRQRSRPFFALPQSRKVI
jgi:hypothetical protein